MKNAVSDTLPGITQAIGPILLEGAVQHYDWGERGRKAFIPKLTGQPAEDGRPYAELWFGAHPANPSLASFEARKTSLENIVKAAPKIILGRESLRRFQNRLPFLVKILDVARPLSVQAHPNDSQARRGFRREEKQGIPLNAPHRNYRDDRAKPELTIALSDFYALCRFRSRRDIVHSFETLPDFSTLLQRTLKGRPPESLPLKQLYRHLMTMPQPQVDVLLTTFIWEISQGKARREWKTIRPWLSAAEKEFSVHGHKDPGLFAFLLLNFIHLKPGDALFLPAGELHAYLGGRAVEVMSNSDNVLRGGLTVKHVDVPELLKLLTFVSSKPNVLRPDRAGRYRTAAREFDIRVLNFAGSAAEISVNGADRGAELILNIKGTALLSCGNKQHLLGRGQSALVPSCVKNYRLKSLSPKTSLYLTGIAGRKSAIRWERP